MSYYGAYFVMAIPAGAIAKKFGYKGGVIAGLALFVIGSIITVPATNAASFALFLVSTFVVAAGATTLEANCNPYITKLGDEKHESMRLNLAQSFNGVGSIVGPLIMAQILSTTVAAGQPGFAEAKTAFLGSTRGIYIVIAIVLAIMLAVFVFVKLPTPPNDVEEAGSEKAAKGGALKKPYFKLGVVAEFFYVGIQTVGFSLFATLRRRSPALDEPRHGPRERSVAAVHHRPLRLYAASGQEGPGKARHLHDGCRRLLLPRLPEPWRARSPRSSWPTCSCPSATRRSSRCRCAA